MLIPPIPIARCESDFVITQVARLLQRYSISYYRECFCMEYFIDDLATRAPVSAALVFSCNPSSKELHVSRFHPELYRQGDSKYISAACFYLLIHHFAEAYALDDSYHISLETVPSICNRFYLRLKDFNFQVKKHGLGEVVVLSSDLIRLPVDTSMIRAHLFDEGDIPLMR